MLKRAVFLAETLESSLNRNIVEYKRKLDVRALSFPIKFFFSNNHTDTVLLTILTSHY